MLSAAIPVKPSAGGVSSNYGWIIGVVSACIALLISAIVFVAYKKWRQRGPTNYESLPEAGFRNELYYFNRTHNYCRIRKMRVFTQAIEMRQCCWSTNVFECTL
jgi:hypothetical protein